MNLTEGLTQLLQDGVVDDVLQQIKSGKEADVFLVRRGDALFAAKVYKARNERNFKNNAGYLEGRSVRSSRDARAMAKGSRYGREQQEQAWKSAEVDALYKLHAAGVRVPAPDIFYEGVLVMSLVVDAQGYPAPRLADLRFEAAQAEALYADLLRQAGIMLTCDLIHGDLSSFNVLLAHDGPTIIDLPQVVTAAGNPQAEAFFRRDVRNLHAFFSQFSPTLRSRPDGGGDLWKRYARGELFAGYVPDLATVVDDTPVATFKARHGDRPRTRGGGQQRKGPEVTYVRSPGASLASTAAAGGAATPDATAQGSQQQRPQHSNPGRHANGQGAQQQRPQHSNPGRHANGQGGQQRPHDSNRGHHANGQGGQQQRPHDSNRGHHANGQGGQQQRPHDSNRGHHASGQGGQQQRPHDSNRGHHANGQGGQQQRPQHSNPGRHANGHAGQQQRPHDSNRGHHANGQGGQQQRPQHSNPGRHANGHAGQQQRPHHPNGPQQRHASPPNVLVRPDGSAPGEGAASPDAPHRRRRRRRGPRPTPPAST